ncbi:hypothetical protein V6N00_13010 [Tersicoccus sp. MR15.9]|uniref:hypothetical protein n=1 Tax=Tersicoccus mangrovi TaxID=3121635 RepID=UPI002FE546FF
MSWAMTNKSKDKGDRFEREAVKVLIEALPGLTRPKAMRLLGAGRKEDVGDLAVLPDAAIQVRAKKDMGASIRSAAVDSVTQAGHGDMRFALGMVPILGTRAHQVRWIATTVPEAWPVPVTPVAEFAMVSRALTWMRDDAGPHGYRVWERTERIGLLAGPGPTVLVAPLEAWAAAYTTACGRTPVLPVDVEPGTTVPELVAV